MSNVKNLTNPEILKGVEKSEGFPGYIPGMIFDVWVRSDEDEYNKFDDKVYTFWVDEHGTPQFVMVCSGTSNAGAEGLKRFDKYNREGCAILKSNVFVKDSHAFGYHKGNPDNPAYRQAADFPYYRDGDKDDKSEEIGKIHHGIIGANCHKAGEFSTEIGGWSVACLVRNVKTQFNKWLKWMDRRPLSVVILTEAQIAAANGGSTSAAPAPAVAPVRSAPETILPKGGGTTSATRRDLELQFLRVRNNGWLPAFQREAERAGTTTAHLLGKGSTETNLKNIRGDFRGGVYHGYGINQVDIGTYPNAPQEWSPENFEPFFVKGVDIYISKLNQVKNGQGKALSVRGHSFVGQPVDAEDLRRIGTADYNCGLWGYYHFSKGTNIDSSTTHKKYSREVYDRSIEFADLLEKAGLEPGAVAQELALQGKYARREHLDRFKVEATNDRLKLPHDEPMETQEELERVDYEREDTAAINSEESGTGEAGTSAETEIIEKTEEEIPGGTTTEEKKETIFTSDTIPQLMPKIDGAKRWLGGGAAAGLFATISGWFAGLPPYMVFLLGVLTGMALMGLILILWKHYGHVFDLSKHVAAINGEKTMNNIQLFGDIERYRQAVDARAANAGLVGTST